ncbi:hypothetical protein C8F04DRAFT_1181093 [Mycena alexandri]|uniref:Uncharacterized protein n=1 Tax=Mycena alexandri TaxID=1745969 RepID=A0AAD6T3P4_9AGAR|nr:hypothetical protein C8F04DRAFT_1181093 [Mycena alexandri]
MEIDPDIPNPATRITPHPGASFFAKESAVHATTLLGCHKQGTHFQIALSTTHLAGNSFVFKTRVNRKPSDFKEAKVFHAYVLGIVETIDTVNAFSDEPYPRPVQVHRMSVTQVDNPSEKAAEMFGKDCFLLNNTLDQETSNPVQKGVIVQAWTRQTPSASILIDYSSATDVSRHKTACISELKTAQVIGGPLKLGDSVLVDVTLHRHDSYIEGTLAKKYYLIAHNILIVDKEDLRLAGYTDTVGELSENVYSEMDVEQ